MATITQDGERYVWLVDDGLADDLDDLAREHWLEIAEDRLRLGFEGRRVLVDVRWSSGQAPGLYQWHGGTCHRLGHGEPMPTDLAWHMSQAWAIACWRCQIDPGAAIPL